MKDEIQIEIVIKGEEAIVPVNGAGYSFVHIPEAKRNGLVVTFGLRGSPGVFIPEKMIRDAMEKFEKALGKLNKISHLELILSEWEKSFRTIQVSSTCEESVELASEALKFRSEIERS